ncbi:GNAT family N-acetyltransferase [Marinilabilia salmonicolor]|uniref:GNAT family N-acetyltransferase n=1 Tax=Marinilabilia salmonicolor TaxID=989 RepID=UPI00029AC93B|nr:GNAT family N-acetyltransferase [Marinilabilia salmonicolor]
MLIVFRKTEKDWIKNLNEFESSVFLNPGWINSIANKDLEPVYFDLINPNGEIEGKISGMRESNHRLGKNQLFFHAGFAVKQKSSASPHALLDALYKYASDNNIDRIIISSYGYAPFLENPGHSAYWSTKRFEYKIMLSQHTEKDLHHQIKRHLKKAVKTETIFREVSDISAIPRLMELLNNVKNERLKKSRSDYNPLYLRHFTPETIERLIKSEDARIFTIQSNEGIHAIELVLECCHQAYMLLKATDNFGYQKGLSSLLNIKVIEEYKKKGFICYNLGGRPQEKDGDGLALYKTRLGAKAYVTYGATTNFIQFPQKALNPLLNIGRTLPDNRLTHFLKKMI